MKSRISQKYPNKYLANFIQVVIDVSQFIVGWLGYII